MPRQPVRGQPRTTGPGRSATRNAVLAVVAAAVGAGAAIVAVPAWRTSAQAQLCQLTDLVACPLFGDTDWVIARDPLREQLDAVDSQIRDILRAEIRDSLDSAMSVNVWKRPFRRNPLDSVERSQRLRQLTVLTSQRDSLLARWKPRLEPASR